ncbi:diguanylate cyclase [Enterobacillus tribolii]|uniref:diguanylate cyclase n=1 Tax=Enterobacillus tribolii TaxID=1487935 RepID=A0A370QQ77_9GAMM|nr:diguanylate cyclase [Enterobacillus tribolii]MBW7981561.1 diguanylate cyclase [Enterobacillus tribolii]RDK90938.1 diguanylate cyclase (GGDEF)-like protein [Enterobacillus tribolii]
MNANSYDNLLKSKSRLVLLLFLLLNGSLAFYALLNPLQTNPPYTLPGIAVLCLSVLCGGIFFFQKNGYILKLNISALILGILWAAHISIKFAHVQSNEHTFLLLNLFSIFFIGMIALSDHFLAFCLYALPSSLAALYLNDLHNISRIIFIVVLPLVAFSVNLMMGRRLEHFTRRLVTRLEQDRERYNDLSMQDPLTGLLNRRGLEEKFSEFKTTDTDHSPHFVVMIDIDHFKSFNDRYGHQLGDRTLVVISSVIRDALRGRDLAVRYGGEEFLLVLRDASETLAVQLCEHIRQHVEKMTTDNDIPCRITLSAGLAPLRRHNLEEAITRADEALYLSKQRGRNIVSLAT